MSRDKIRFIERVAIGLYSFLFALFTSSIIWLVINYELIFVSSNWVVFFKPVIIFSIFVGILGFIAKTNLVANIFGFLWHLLLKYFRWGY